MSKPATLVLLLALLPACPRGGDTQDSEAEVTVDAQFGIARNAVVLVLDGARIEETFGDDSSYGAGYSDAWGGPTEEVLPTMRSQLLPQGALARPGYILGSTVTAPAHSDMFTGVHRPMGPISNAGDIAYVHPNHPTIFELARDQLDLGEEEAVLLGNTYHVSSLYRSTQPAYGVPLQGGYVFVADEDGVDFSYEDQDVMSAVNSLLASGSRLVVANLHQIDRDGHNHPQIHAKTIQKMDGPITDLWSWIQSAESGIEDETLMVVLSDHGRHRFEDVEYPFKDHGCDCSGCREAPMLLLGPWVQRGVVADSPVVIEDLSQTIAWLMGFDMPYGKGMVRWDLLGGTPEVQQPTGPRALHGSGDLLGYEEPTGDFSQRSEVWIDDHLVSDADAILVQAPRVLHTQEADFGCWRQLTIGTEAEFWPWSLHCSRRPAGGDWEDIGFPDIPVIHHLIPALAVDDSGTLYLSFADGYGITESGNPMESAPNFHIRLVRWSELEGWEMAESSPTGAFHPFDTALVLDEESAWVAFSCSEEGEPTPYSRHIEVHKAVWADAAEPSWEKALDVGGLDDEGRQFYRMESPALWANEGGILLAFLGYDEDRVHTVVSIHDRGTGLWSPPHTVDDIGRTLPHIAPAISQQGWLYWAQLGEQDDDVEVCRLQTIEESPDCQSTGRAFIDSLAPSDDGCWVSLSEGDGLWEKELLSW